MEKRLGIGWVTTSTALADNSRAENSAVPGGSPLTITAKATNARAGRTYAFDSNPANALDPDVTFDRQVRCCGSPSGPADHAGRDRALVGDGHTALTHHARPRQCGTVNRASDRARLGLSPLPKHPDAGGDVVARLDLPSTAAPYPNDTGAVRRSFSIVFIRLPTASPYNTSPK